MPTNTLRLSNCLIRIYTLKITVVLFLFVQITSFGQTKINTALWEVSGKNLTKPSYLFGTNHLFGNSIVDSSKVILEKLNLSELIVGETLQTSSGSTIDLLNAYARKDSLALKKALSKKDYKFCLEAFKTQYKMDDKMMGSLLAYPPLILSIVLIMIDNEWIANMLENEISIDDYIQQYAVKHGKMVKALETSEFQIKALNNFSSTRKMAKGIVAYLKDVEKKKELKEKMDAYANHSFDYAFNKNTPHAGKLLLWKRNKDWMKILPGLMEKQPTFIAVGWGHFMYRQGLIIQLRKLGYTVSPVKMD